MLNIPTSVKNLLAIDGTRKNFRAHFPNAEFPDITNENVVQESVRYSASICSQDSFKFGLVEASSLEFETVGVGNMYGMSIDCSFDVDVTTLTDAEQSALAAWAGDGSYTNETDSDIGFPFFSVPLGRFLVKRCPRNHGAMTHRQVTAYTENFASATQMNPIEQHKIALKFEGIPNYRMAVKQFVAENLAYYDTNVLATLGYNSTVDVQVFSTMFDTGNRPSVATILYDSTGTRIGSVIAGYNERYAYLNSNSTTSTPTDQSLYGFAMGNHPGQEAIAEIFNFIKNSGADISRNGYDTVEELVRNTIAIGVLPSLGFNRQATPDPNGRTHYYFLPGDPAANCFYAYIYAGIMAFVKVPYNITVQYELNGETTTKTYAPLADLTDDIKAYRYIDSAPTSFLGGTTLDFAATLNYKFVDGSLTYLLYSFINAYSFRKILSSYCELLGMFCQPRPSGGYDLITLNKTVRAQITPDEYSELWWDEYDIDNIGTVLYTFTSGSETQTNEYLISTGSSIYDMTDNYIIEHLTAATPAKIEALIKKTFKPRLSAINYTPIDLTMAAQLHLEPGDYIQLTAEDGTVIYSYIMRRELSGIQMLTDVISSVAGEIIETVEEE